MNILEFLKPFIGLSAPGGSLTEAHYARLPFLALANRQAPFAAWRQQPEGRIPAGLEALWQEAGAGCLLCAFHAVNAVTVGHRFAERILERQKGFLDALRPGLGAQYEVEIRRLYDFASRPLQIRSRDGDLLEIPSDWRIAVDYLLTSAASPFRDESQVFSIEGAPSFPEEVDVALAADLEHGWSAASEHFAGLVETVRPD